MRLQSSFAIAIASAVTMTLGATLPADAACKRMGFLVNDYGKDGPTKDAQELLEKDIAKWAAGQGIKSYTVNKKDVSCELFLNFIVFDEHTCTASATVCWDEKNPGKPAAVQDAKAGDAPASGVPVVEKTADTNTDAKATAAADKATAEAMKAKAKADKAAKVETGAVDAKPDTKPAAVPDAAATASPTKSSTGEMDASQAAAAAAERAAAAAERAAVAAERAAQAAMDAQQAPAAVAAGSSGSGQASAATATAQPITPLPSTAKP